MHCYIRGVNHETAPVEIRERLAFGKADLGSVLDVFSREGAAEAFVLSTCHRTEFYIAGAPPADLDGLMTRALDVVVGHGAVREPGYWYEHNDEEAVGHLFRVASGLDSMVVGEPEILGQVKAAIDASREAGSAGAFLNEVFHRCLHVAKRVRTDTAIGVGSVSLASATHGVMRNHLEDLAGRRVLLFGTGEIAEQVAQYLGGDMGSNLTVLSRTPERAAGLAASVGASACDASEKLARLRVADGVVCASSAPYHLVRADEIRPLVEERAEPMVLVDLGHPRNIDPAIAEISGARLYGIDDLRAEIDRNNERRRHEVPAAEAIVRRETAQLAQWHTSLPAQDTVKTLRRKFEDVRQTELDRMRGRLSEDEWAAVDEASRRMLQKLLHTPPLALKGLNADEPADRDRISIIASMFGLKADVGQD
ncbi:glutamyl-tRNA reductase [Candidatus Poribacteria bacterium]|nr:glutamyl-tRNA reductase [Candidatus Poribacteria bacterium]